MASNLTKYPGRDFVLKVRMPSGNFETLGGCRSNSQSNANETIDVSNKSDGVWRQMIPGAQKAMSLSAGGVVTNDAVFAYATTELRNDRGLEVMTCYGDGRIEYAPVLGTSSEITGEYNGSQDFSLSLESAATVTELAIDVLPDYRLDFAGEQSLAPVFGEGDVTFLRASSGTYLGFDGLIKTAAIDTPRFEHDASGACLGLLVEEQRTNVLLASAGQNSAPWIPASATVEGGQLAPDGTLTATRITSTVGGGRVVEPVVIGTTGRYTYSGFLKPVVGTAFHVLVRNDTTGTNYSALIDNDGTVTSETLTTAQATVYPNGYIRFAITADDDFTAGDGVTAYFYAGNGSLVGQASDVWGAQMELGASATSYIATGAAQVTRAADDAQALITPVAAAYALAATGVRDIDQGSRYLATIAEEADPANHANLRTVSGTVRGSVFDGGVPQAVLDAAAAQPGNIKAALSLATNNVLLVANGGPASVDGAAVIPSPVAVLTVGALPGSPALNWNGPIAQLNLYAQGLAPADLQALTE